MSSFHSFSTHDGPGIRATVFLQGCPLRCQCCHNPETWERIAGEEVSVEEIIQKVKKGLSYYRRGGITCSGGEPLLQSQFVKEIFAQAKELGLHTTLDTSGCVLDEAVIQALNETDLVLLDIKKTTEEEYWDFARGSLKKTLEFLDQLEKMKKPVWVRHVVIPQQETKESIQALKKIVQNYTCVEKVEFLPFKKLCLSKYEELQMDFPLNDIDEANAELMKQINEWYEMES
ncbi:MAG: pyruvate formate-lyase-activating protein [Anaerorhabdus sp.]